MFLTLDPRLLQLVYLVYRQCTAQQGSDYCCSSLKGTHHRLAATHQCLPTCHLQTSTAPVSLTMAIYTRLGCLFLDFKAKPAACTLFFLVKLCKSLMKGVLVGVFYGE
jgi:hypothetical protein